jgi:DNA mismatch repair protein MSH6
VRPWTKLTQSFETIQAAFEELAEQCQHFDSNAIPNLLRSAPDLTSVLKHIRSLFKREQDGALAIMS